MVSIRAGTAEEYLRQLPEERRAVVEQVRQMVRRHLPSGYVEGAGFGMLTYHVPLERTGPTYNGQPLCYVAIAAQKHHYALYLMGAYMDPALTRQVQDAFRRAGKRLDMGKSCVRFRSLDTIPLADLGPVVAGMPVDDFVARYQGARAASKAPGTRSSDARTRTAAAAEAARDKTPRKRAPRR